MVGPVATCGGSAGGAQPPHEHPHMIPSNCQSAPANAPPARKGRGKAIGKKILMRVGQVGGPIPLNWDIRYGTWKALGPDASLYASGVGIQVRHCCEPYHEGWEKVPDDQKELTYERIKGWFAVSDPVLAGVLRRDCGDAYRGWKNDLKDHFNKNGGKDNPDRARLHPHSSIRDVVHWELCIKRMLSSKFEEQSRRNSGNRGKHKWVSYHGRRSFPQYREMLDNSQPQDPDELHDLDEPHDLDELDGPPQKKTAIQVWGDLHRHGDEWVNNEAKEAHCSMKERVAAHGTSLTPTDELTIIGDVLGRRRGHITGVGPSAPRATLSSTQPSQTSTSFVSRQEHETLLKGFSMLMAYIKERDPDARLPDFPIHSQSGSCTPSSSSGPTSDRDDVAQ